MFDCRPKLNASIHIAREANARLNRAASNASQNWRTKNPQLYYELVASAENLLDACEELDKVLIVVDVSGQEVGMDLSIVRSEVRNWRWSAKFQGNASKAV